MTEEMQRSDPAVERRERRIWAGVAVGGVVVALLVLALGWPIVERRLVAARQLDRAIVLVEETDPQMTAVDTAVGSIATTTRVWASREASAVLRPADAKLREAVTLIDSGLPRLTEDEQTRAMLVRSVAEMRLLMLAQAKLILPAEAEMQPPSAGAASDVSAAPTAVLMSAYLNARQRAAEADEALLSK